MTTTCLAIDPEALLGARRELLRRELALSAVDVTPPDTGATTAVTGYALDRVAATASTLTVDLHGLADALGRLVDDLAEQEGQVTAMFDLLRMGSVS